MLVDDAIKFAEEMDKTGSTGKFVDALTTLAGEVNRLRRNAGDGSDGKMPVPEYRWQVDIIESERGWGQKIEEQKKFVTNAEAEEFVDMYNAKNDKDYVPDWYMYASRPYPIPPKR